MEINIGDYVRTPKQGIFIISHINKPFKDDDENKVCLCQNSKVAFASINTIKQLKHSKEIIDLIQEDDLIEIEYETSDKAIQNEVVQVIRNFQGILYVNTFVGKFFIQDLEHYNRKILSITTKEQIKQIEYRIKE